MDAAVVIVALAGPPSRLRDRDERGDAASRQSQRSPDEPPRVVSSSGTSKQFFGAQ
jgi:hypothetical protein